MDLTHDEDAERFRKRVQTLLGYARYGKCGANVRHRLSGI